MRRSALEGSRSKAALAATEMRRTARGLDRGGREAREIAFMLDVLAMAIESLEKPAAIRLCRDLARQAFGAWEHARREEERRAHGNVVRLDEFRARRGAVVPSEAP